MCWETAVQAVSAAATSFTPVIVSAATQAAYGAAIGAVVSAITGKDVGTGALIGAGAGALTGGISGALGNPSDPLGILDETQAGTSNPLATMGDEDVVAGSGPPVASEAAGAVSTAPGSVGIFDEGGFVERHGEFLGGAVGGIGKGLLSGLALEEQSKAGLERDRLADERVRENFRGTTEGSRGLIAKRALVDDNSDRPPGDTRFDPRLLTGRYQWDPVQRRIVQIAA